MSFYDPNSVSASTPQSAATSSTSSSSASADSSPATSAASSSPSSSPNPTTSDQPPSTTTTTAPSTRDVATSMGGKRRFRSASVSLAAGSGGSKASSSSSPVLLPVVSSVKAAANQAGSGQPLNANPMAMGVRKYQCPYCEEKVPSLKMHINAVHMKKKSKGSKKTKVLPKGDESEKKDPSTGDKSFKKQKIANPVARPTASESTGNADK